MIENALYVHAFGYMVELTVAGCCIIAILGVKQYGLMPYCVMHLSVLQYIAIFRVSFRILVKGGRNET